MFSGKLQSRLELCLVFSSADVLHSHNLMAWWPFLTFEGLAWSVSLLHRTLLDSLSEMTSELIWTWC